MKKSIQSFRKAIKRFGDRFGSHRTSQHTKLMKSRSPQLEKFEDRVLLSISPSVLGANQIDEGGVYAMQLSAGDDAVARWDIDWGDGTTTTGNINGWGENISFNADGTWTATHVYADDMTASITATAYDDIDAGAAFAASVSSVVSVADTAPVLTLKSSEPMKDGRTFAVILSSEDLGTDTINRWKINWGDGQVSHGSMPEPISESQTDTAVLPEDKPLDVSRLFDPWDPETWTYLDSVLETTDSPQVQENHDWGDGIIQITPNLWVAAHTYENGGSYNVTAIASDENGTHAAFGKAGNVDRRFGQFGKAQADFGNELDAYASKLFVDDDGRFVMVGYVDDGIDRDYAIARFNEDGTADTSFYGDGNVVIDSESLDRSGIVNIAGLQIVAAGDGASTVTDTSMITSAMYDAMLHVNGVNVEIDLFNASIAGTGAATDAFYGPLPLADNLSVITDNGVLHVNPSFINGHGFGLTRFYGNDGKLTINVQQGQPLEEASSESTTASEEDSISSEPIMVAMMSSGTSAKMYLEGDSSIKEGSEYGLTITVSDLAVGETVESITVVWGDGSPDSFGEPPQSGYYWGDGITQTGANTWTATHVYDDGNYAIEVTATTTNGTVWEYHPPIPGDINMDGKVDDIDATILAVNWGAGPGCTWSMGDFNDDGYVNSEDAAILSSHWLDNIDYGDGQLIVDNVEPLLTLSGTGSADEGDLYTLNLESSDPGDDTITVWEIDWGDGATETFTKQPDDSWASDGSGTLSAVVGTDNQWTATHYFADNGEYTVNATATDEDGSWEAYGSYGTLDRHFGEDATGWVVKDFGGTGAFATQMMVQDDGKIIVVGYGKDATSSDNDLLMARYNTDGTLDTSFGNNGLAVTDLGYNDCCFDVAQQSDGKIVLAGYSFISNDPTIALARYSSDGIIDAGDPNVLNDGFGGNDTGFVLEDFDGGRHYAFNLTILPDTDEIITAGRVGNYDVLFAKFDSDGSLDTSFGNNGELIFDMDDISGRYGGAYSVEVLWERETPVLVGVGSYNSASSSELHHGLFFFDATGTRMNIGTNGVVEVNVGSGSESAYSIIIDRGPTDAETDDRIITSGYVGDDLAVARFTPYGNPIENFVLDSNFDIDGVTGSNDYWLDYDAGVDMGFGVALLANGQIITAGTAEIDGNRDLALAGLNGSDGHIDENFATNGKLTIDIAGNYDVARDIVLDKNDDILVAGITYIDGHYQSVITRLYGEDAGHKVEISNVVPELELTVEGMVDDQVTLKTFESLVINGTITDPGFDNSPGGTWEYVGYSVNWG